MKLVMESEDVTEEPVTVNGVDKEKDKDCSLANDALRLLGEGDINGALVCLNACLIKNRNGLTLNNNEVGGGGKGDLRLEGSRVEDIDISPADEISLLEKRCLIHMKLQNYDDVLQDARVILDNRTDHSLAYKCLLVALCKTNRLEPVPEILKLWKSYSPNDLDMIESRTKLEALLLAVKNGIDPGDAFSKIEDQLGLTISRSSDWLLARKPQDPRWKYRPLPHGQSQLSLCLSFRYGGCPMGVKCPDAHGPEELEEWKSRSTVKTVSMLLDNIELDSGKKYIQRILNRLKEVGDPTLMLSDVSDGVKIKCSQPLDAVVQLCLSKSKRSKTYKWTFAIESKKPLTHICLLQDIHREYFAITSATIIGPGNKLSLMSGTDCNKSDVQVVETSNIAQALTLKKLNIFTYKIDVRFKPEIYGTFRQTALFDTGDDDGVKFVRHISVEVVPAPEKSSAAEDDTAEECSGPTNQSFNRAVTWNHENAYVIDAFSGGEVDVSKVGFSSIDLPPLADFSDTLCKENYKERMAYFLTAEEKSRQTIIAKYNLTAPLSLMESYVMTSGFQEGLTRYAVDGSLYGKMTLFRDVSEDTAVGRLILRSCNYLLLAKTEEIRNLSDGKKPTVYLCPISDKTKNDIYVDVGPACVKDLELNDKDCTLFDIQFQLDRTAFLEMKAVVNKLQAFHLEMLFPDFSLDYNIPWSPSKQWDEVEDPDLKLNPRQKESLIAITSESPKIPPILVIGPFGTGKTFSLAQCVKKLVLTDPKTRILVCTHSNSAADLYIKDYLDPWCKEGLTSMTPLRIYYHLRNLNSVHPDVLQYCLVESLRFRPPTLDEVMAHRVIVVTLSTSYILMQMNLPADTFSHILLDEAAQAMESEAITPLMCAGQKTKLVLAGDHMQLSPELFSEEAKTLQPSLLERLHNYYPDTHPCKLMLCENYRTHSAIIDFVSEEFYSKKLQCSKIQPVHDTFYPLSFFSARGEEIQEKDSSSYFNKAEGFEIVKRVSELVALWPESWGNHRQESAIGILTPYSDQVSWIRSALRKKGLGSISVERVLNVQGKQFRAIFLSTVRSLRPWVKILPEAVGNEVDLGFFSNPKLLNTALTRAQSFVGVIGDPVSLCSEGKCRNLWKDFISICNENKSLYGITFTQLEQNILGLEMRVTWGLNPLADVFEPKTRPANNFNAIAQAGFDSPRPKNHQKSSTTPQSSPSTSDPKSPRSPGKNQKKKSTPTPVPAVSPLAASHQPHTIPHPGQMTSPGLSMPGGHQRFPSQWGPPHPSMMPLVPPVGVPFPVPLPFPYPGGYPILPYGRAVPQPVVFPAGPGIPMPAAPGTMRPENFAAHPQYLRMPAGFRGAVPVPTRYYNPAEAVFPPFIRPQQQQMLHPHLLQHPSATHASGPPTMAPAFNRQSFPPLPGTQVPDNPAGSLNGRTTPRIVPIQSGPPQAQNFKTQTTQPNFKTDTNSATAGSYTTSTTEDDLSKQPLGELLHFREMLQKFSSSDITLLRKVEEAIILAQMRENAKVFEPIQPVHSGPSMLPRNREEIHDIIRPSPLMPSEPRISEITQKLDEAHLNQTVESIWADLGFTDNDSNDAPPNSHPSGNGPSLVRESSGIPLPNLSTSAYDFMDTQNSLGLNNLHGISRSPWTTSEVDSLFAPTSFTNSSPLLGNILGAPNETNAKPSSYANVLKQPSFMSASAFNAPYFMPPDPAFESRPPSYQPPTTSSLPSSAGLPTPNTKARPTETRGRSHHNAAHHQSKSKKHKK